MSELVDEIDAVRLRLAVLDPACLAPGACATLVHELGALVKAASAACARLAARAADGGVERTKGFLDADEWLASETGTSSSEAKRRLQAAREIERHERTREAVARGELSLEQGHEVARTEAAVPGTEGELLVLARTAPLRRLRERARRTRLEAEDAERLAARQRRLRHFRHWTDDDGMFRFSGALEPVVGVAFLARAERETEAVRVAARRVGEEEAWEAHAADALVTLVAGGGRTARSGATDVVLTCDIDVYRGGGAGHIVGDGPVPASRIRRALDEDAFLKVAFHDGVDVRRVKHFGRHIPAELRTALELGAAPDFDGVRCGCGCGKRYRIQWDHIDPRANGGATCLANLQPLTAREHGEKTRRDRAAGLLDGRSPP